MTAGRTRIRASSSATARTSPGWGGTAHYVRTKLDGTYFIPLDRYTGNSDWGFAISAGGGYLSEVGGHQEKIIDRFFLGGDNLRGFQSAGAGPHAIPIQQGWVNYGSDSIGGRFIYTQSTELHFPLPISAGPRGCPAGRSWTSAA